MAEIVMDTISFAIMAGVNLKDWDKVNQDFELKESNLEPYELCGWSCVSRAKECATRRTLIQRRRSISLNMVNRVHIRRNWRN